MSVMKYKWKNMREMKKPKIAVSSLRQCLRLPSTKTSRDTASIEFEPPGRLPGEWLREAGRGWKVSDKFLRERLTVNSDLWVASSPSNDIIELEDPHVPFPDSALTTFAADHNNQQLKYYLSFWGTDGIHCIQLMV
ncbi:hypothetical protein OUZ56_001372 [Daphnia magna]|uniref:Uncharacterized protein n=1 Tax=Daphnia magna TaxID=35525 RepID=A0ABR0A2H1_9CRUS|nr:hypothetical protein OUZ56_001372 [Daphnia magna]